MKTPMASPQRTPIQTHNPFGAANWEVIAEFRERFKDELQQSQVVYYHEDAE